MEENGAWPYSFRILGAGGIMKYLALLLCLGVSANAGMCINPPVPEDGSLVSRDVYMMYRITLAGTVKDIVVLLSSGNAEFDTYAVECASHWRYRPAMAEGKPIEVPRLALMRRQHTAELAAFDKVGSAAFACLKSPPPTPDEMKAVLGPTVVNVRFSRGIIVSAEVVRSSGGAVLDERAARCYRTAAVDAEAGRTLGSSEWKRHILWESILAGAQ